MSTPVFAVVQARMDSSRLPGKVLRLMLGRPMLAHLLDGLTRCTRLDGVVLATSVEPSDDPLEAFAREYGVPVHRGPLDHVAQRVHDAAAAHGAGALVRVCADSPLLSPALVDEAVALFREHRPDLASNVLTRTFPKGQSVEVLARRTLAEALPRLADDAEREHVTRHFYANADAYRIAEFRSGHDWGRIQLSVDTAEDFSRAEALLAAMDRPHWEYGCAELVALAQTLEARP